MSKLEKELDDLLASTEEGAGFGDPDALRAYERKIENLRFKISQRNTYKIAIISALIGVVSSIITLIVTGFIGRLVP